MSLTNVPIFHFNDKEGLKEFINRQRSEDKKIVFTNGCFDLLHTGHIRVLNESKNLGDILIVGLNSDSSIKKLKGDDRPIIGEEDRSIIISNLKAVDCIVIYEDESVYDLVGFIKPDFLVKGGDYSIESVVGHEIVLGYGGKVLLVPVENGRSTTSLIQKIIDK